MKKHGFTTKTTKHPFYASWVMMKVRCKNASHERFKHYGGRGITVCERWLKFENFKEDMFPSYKEGLQLDRIDVNGNYEPSNCRWVTPSQNMKNRQQKAKEQSTMDYVSIDSRDNQWIYKRKFKTKEEAENFALRIEINRNAI